MVSKKSCYPAAESMPLTGTRGSIMKRHLLTVLILVAAVCSSVVGFKNSAFMFIVLGGAMELWFWVRALRSSDKQQPVSQRP